MFIHMLHTSCKLGHMTYDLSMLCFYFAKTFCDLCSCRPSQTPFDMQAFRHWIWMPWSADSQWQLAFQVLNYDPQSGEMLLLKIIRMMWGLPGCIEGMTCESIASENMAFRIPDDIHSFETRATEQLYNFCWILVVSRTVIVRCHVGPCAVSTH